MPLYDWICKACGKKEAVVISVEERDIPPPPHQRDACSAAPTELHEWIRDLPRSQTVVKSASWGRGKGHW